MVRLTIDNQEIQVNDGVTILEAATQAGIRIPTLCYHEKLLPFGACRICVVEVEQMKGRLTPSCSTPVTEGMVVRTTTEQIIKARKTVLELLLIHHPLDCPFCDKGGECQLQDLVYEYEVSSNRFTDKKSEHPIDYVSPLVERNTNRCVLCGMCVRICDEVVGASELSMVNRGIRTKITTDFERPLNCEFCGECENICPVGALTDRMFKFKARAWELQTVPTVCSFCSTGCAIKLCIKDGKIVRVLGEPEGGANKGSLCIKGRFGYEYSINPERIKRPFIRKNGKLREATWQEAIQAVAQGLRSIKDNDGPDAIAGLCSARLNNEDAYLFQKLLRVVIGTNNIDNSCGYAHRGFSNGLIESFGNPDWAPALAALKNSDVFLVIRSNVSETHPVVGYQVTAAVKQRGACLIAADPRRIKLARFANVYLPHKPGTEVALLNGLASIILREGLQHKEFLAVQTQGVEALTRALEPYTPAYVANITGCTPDSLQQAARLFASAKRGVIIISAGMGFFGDDIMLARSAANLVLITGNAGKPGAGVLFLGEKNNSHGIVEMGAVPDLLPGFQQIGNAAVRQKFEKAWGTVLPSAPGMTAEQMLEGIDKGAIKALYCAGENPLADYPDRSRVKKALGQVQFLVVQDLFMSPTAELAHVVFPAVSLIEKEGTYTNCEHRVQKVKPALPRYAEAQPDAEIFCAVAQQLGTVLGPGKPAEIMKEIAGLIPQYQSVSYDSILTEGLQLGGNGASADTAEKQEEQSRRAQLMPADSLELPAASAAFPYILLTGSSLFHSGSLSTKSKAICTVQPEAVMDISPTDSQALGIASGDTVKVTSAQGSITIKTRVTAKQNQGSVFIPYHFFHAPVQVLTDVSQPLTLVNIEKQTA